jgi:hypothetical protein
MITRQAEKPEYRVAVRSRIGNNLRWVKVSLLFKFKRDSHNGSFALLPQQLLC